MDGIVGKAPVRGRQLDEQDIPRYANVMVDDAEIIAALAASTKKELAREQRQRDWLKKKGFE